MQTCPRVRKMNEPIAEQTKMAWIIMSPSRENDLVHYVHENQCVMLTVSVI